jgi:23S rRNA pseudouridine1911/1915/1917 synthase
MNKSFEFDIPLAYAGLRLDVALAQCFSAVSRTQIRRACDHGLICCNYVPLAAKTKVVAGQHLSIQWLEREETTLQPRAMDLEILFEDEVMLAVNKPSGEVVHPAPHVQNSFVEAVLSHTQGQLAWAAGAKRPGVVHRLDKETTGILVFAKTDLAYHRLSQMFMRREVKKYYDALAHGKPCVQSGSIREPIGRDPHYRTRMAIRRDGRPAHTDWECLKYFSQNVSLFFLRLHTGRTHQIRVHLASMGCPILGDKTYGFREEWLPNVHIPRIFLHACRMELCHPLNGNSLTLSAPCPADMENFMTNLGEQKFSNP